MGLLRPGEAPPARHDITCEGPRGERVIEDVVLRWGRVAQGCPMIDLTVAQPSPPPAAAASAQEHAVTAISCSFGSAKLSQQFAVSHPIYGEDSTKSLTF